MKRYEIDELLTAAVTKFLMEGYVINTKSMSGHQGEEGKVDLIKDDELIRVWISRESVYNWSDESKFSGNTMVLRVGRWSYPASKSYKEGYTVWMKDLEVEDEVVFYELSHTNDSWYTDDLDEAICCQEIRHERYRAKRRPYEETILLRGAKEIGIKYLKRKEGYHRVSSAYISLRKQYSRDREHAAYFVVYKGVSRQLR